MSIVAPIAACGAVIPVVYSIATGQVPRPLVTAGLVSALAGVVLASFASGIEVESSPNRRPRLAAAAAVGAAVGFGLFLLLLGRASIASPGSRGRLAAVAARDADRHPLGSAVARAGGSRPRRAGGDRARRRHRQHALSLRHRRRHPGGGGGPRLAVPDRHRPARPPGPGRARDSYPGDRRRACDARRGAGLGRLMVASATLRA